MLVPRAQEAMAGTGALAVPVETAEPVDSEVWEAMGATVV
jgi:hypothetical protein